MKVLLIDDDTAIRFIAATALKRGGFSVATAADGAAGLDAVKADRPDVILLDWMMPELDGPEVCRRLKEDPATADIPIIFMTARSQRAEVARGLALGAAGYIVKPFDALGIGGEIRAILARPADSAPTDPS